MVKAAKTYNLLDYVIPAYLLIALVEYILNNWALEFGIKLLSIGVTLFFLLSNKARHKSTIKSLVTIFLFYNLASIIQYIDRGSIDSYLSELYNYIAAMLFFYVGYFDPRKENVFYNKFLYYCFWAMIIGLFFYIFMPGFHMIRHNTIMSNQWFSDTNYSDNQILSMMRFSGIIGTDYGVGNYCMFGLAIALYYYSRGIKINHIPLVIIILVLIVAGFMTQLRVVIVSATAATIYYLLFGVNKGATKNSIKLIIIALLLGSISVSIINNYFGERASAFKDIIEFTSGRMDFGEAYDERRGQVDAALSAWDNKILGDGMGSANTIASRHGRHAIYDQCYAKMMVELGYVGLFLFLFIIILSLIKGIKHFKRSLIELVIIVFVLCSMIGADTLYFHYFQIIPFWYALGRLWNPFVNHREVLGAVQRGEMTSPPLVKGSLEE